MSKISIEYVRDHVEAHQDGVFLFSSDTMSEAIRDLEDYERGEPRALCVSLPLLSDLRAG